jgi:hypothetical protein
MPSSAPPAFGMKTSAGIASADHGQASRRPATSRSTAKSTARTAAAETAPAITSEAIPEPNAFRNAAWKYGVNGPNQYTTSR